MENIEENNNENSQDLFLDESEELNDNSEYNKKTFQKEKE
jgi:hypothetical protein